MSRAKRSIVAALALVAATPSRAAVDLQPGEWLVGVMIEVPGGRGPNPGKLEQETCLQPSDAQRLVVPPNSPCQVSELRETPQEITWKVSCSQGPMRTRGSGRLQFFGDRFKGTIAMRADPPYDMVLTQHLAGKRLGECKFPRKPPADLKRYEDG
ncbi:MAG: DUF3617 domain-containing protein [Clostridia bacterium]